MAQPNDKPKATVKRVKARAKFTAKQIKPGYAPLTGQPLTRFVGNPTSGLGKYAKLALKALRANGGQMDIKQITDLMVADKAADPKKAINCQYSELPEAKKKIERHTARKVMENLASRGLIEISNADNVTERKVRGGGTETANFGIQKAYQLKEWAAPIVDTL
jgi:hypothetical protein